MRLFGKSTLKVCGQILFLFVLVMSSLVIAGEQVATILETKVICKEPGRYIGWPTICKTRAGELLVAFSGDREAHVCPWGVTEVVSSSDNGKTWSEPVTINNTPLDDRDAGILETESGTFVVSWFTSLAFESRMKPEWERHALKLGPETRQKWLGNWTRRSEDGGDTWEEPVKQNVSGPHGGIELMDGRLLYVGRGKQNGLPVLGVEESRNDGRSWNYIATIPIPSSESMDHYHEPHVVELTNGKLIAMFRCHQPGPDQFYLRQSESEDGGKTWTVTHKTPIYGYPPHLIKLKNDWLVVVYGVRKKPYGERACISKDGGKTWDIENEIVLSPAMNSDLGYPASVQLDDGSIYTIYYQIDKPGEKTCLMGTHWQLEGMDMDTPTGKNVSQLIDLLNDPDNFGSALVELQKLSDPSAGKMLLNYLSRAPMNQKDNIIIALANMGYKPCLPKIRELSGHYDETIRNASYVALAKLTDKKAIDILLNAAEVKTGKEKKSAIQCAINLADNLLAEKQQLQAARIYSSILSLSPRAYIKKLALNRLGQCGDKKDLDTIYLLLSSPDSSIRVAARDALVVLKGKKVTDELLSLYENSNEQSVRMNLLYVISQRDSAKARPLLEKASLAADTDERVLAFSLFYLIDSTKNREVLQQVIKNGLRSEKEAALHSMLKIAENCTQKNPTEAMNLYHQVLSKDAAFIDKQQALESLATINSFESVDVIIPFLYTDELCYDAGFALLKMANTLLENNKVDQAEKLIVLGLGVVKETDIVEDILNKYQQKGGVVGSISTKIGFVNKWRVAGPFPNENNVAREIAYFPEHGIDFSETAVSGEMRASWQKSELDNIYSILSFADLFGRKTLAAYAYTEVTLEKDMDALFKIGSNDGVICWLNGQKVHQHLSGRACIPDQDQVNVKMKKGKNTILLKVLNLGGQWESCLRICDFQGVPLDLENMVELPK